MENIRVKKHGKVKVKAETRKEIIYLLLIVDLFATLTVTYFGLFGYISKSTATYVGDIGLSFFFSLIVFSYLSAKGNSEHKIIAGLGLGRFTRASVAYGLAIFIAMAAIEALLTFLHANASGIQAAPAYYLFFIAIIAPINEEILFRGFLVPRVGIIASALIFAIPHLVIYYSVYELAFAFAFGILAGYAFKKSGSLYSTIIAHMMVNILAVLLLI